MQGTNEVVMVGGINGGEVFSSIKVSEAVKKVVFLRIFPK